MGGLQLRRRGKLDRSGPLEPTDNGWVRIVWIARPGMILRQAMGASGDGPSPAGECLVVKSGIRYRPVQILPGQHVPAELAVIGYPVSALVAVGGLEDGCLVRPQLWGFLGKAGR